ncbi:MAG: molybdopterin-synthase adenylyltransferase MoeB [Planctomycetaceae bacterium]|jgi:adenylyltransferase/sulfurtransferase|nr:molybdopterin-synthase adenylyltransferase MoeB [Planctomycetaceae bacterium]
MTKLSPAELSRYSRHLILPEIGPCGQRKLKNSKVLCVGSGGLGSPIAMYLAAAGVGTLGIIDDDVVSENNLQRQIIHSTRSIKRRKVESAKERLEDLNPHIQVRPLAVRLNASNALDIFKDYDVIVDGTDNFGVRYLINDACVLLGKPDVYGGVLRTEGQASVFHYKGGPCLRCLCPEPPKPGEVMTCTEGGILNVLPGIIGCIQANETIKIILGKGETLANRLLILDAWKMKFREITLQKDPMCPVCGTKPTIKKLKETAAFCAAQAVPLITAAGLKRLLKKEPAALQMIDVREPKETAAGMIPGAVNIPLGKIAARKSKLNPAKPIIFICQSGVRSETAVRELTAAGFTAAMSSLKGGMNTWK